MSLIFAAQQRPNCRGFCLPYIQISLGKMPLDQGGEELKNRSGKNIITLSMSKGRGTKGGGNACSGKPPTTNLSEDAARRGSFGVS